MSLPTFYLEYGRHVARLHRRRRCAYALTSNTAAHDKPEKISSWVSFSLYGYGAPLGGPSGRRSSAISICQYSKHIPRTSYPKLFSCCSIHLSLFITELNIHHLYSLLSSIALVRDYYTDVTSFHFPLLNYLLTLQV